ALDGPIPTAHKSCRGYQLYSEVAQSFAFETLRSFSVARGLCSSRRPSPGRPGEIAHTAISNEKPGKHWSVLAKNPAHRGGSNAKEEFCEVNMKFESLKELYVDELQDIYDAEKEIVKALPKMAESASSPLLKTAFEQHLAQTKGHVSRLEQIFEGLGEKPKAKKCDGVRGILEEGKDLIGQKGDQAVVDAGLIAGAQRVEHYEMAVYGSLKAWAAQCDSTQAVQLLAETLNEEKQADQKLTEIAEGSVNKQAGGAFRGAASA
ncbi:MAG: ferritin-like domain-containing protein, partial [Terriglobia bacterium]